MTTRQDSISKALGSLNAKAQQAREAVRVARRNYESALAQVDVATVILDAAVVESSNLGYAAYCVAQTSIAVNREQRERDEAAAKKKQV